MQSLFRMIFLVPFVISIGCNAGKKEKADIPVPSQTVTTDTSTGITRDINVPETCPLVTFIELGSDKCIPCRMMQPIIAEIEKEYIGQVQVEFHDVWTEAGRPYGEQYGIKAIPTQIFLDKEGKEYFRHTGFFPKEELVKVLKQKGVE